MMRNTLAALLIGFVIWSPAAAAETRSILWHDLLPDLPDLESPFAALTPDQLEDMRTHISWVVAPSAKKDDAFRGEAEAALARLVAGGIDVDGLMAQRRQLILQRHDLALGPNHALLGERVRLPGYVLPLSFDGSDVTEFLLVPSAGACIHTPTPPANQIVHVTYPSGFELGGLFEAVWVEGRLDSEKATLSVDYSDGTGAVEASYVLEAQSVQAYR